MYWLWICAIYGHGIMHPKGDSCMYIDIKIVPKINHREAKFPQKIDPLYFPRLDLISPSKPKILYETLMYCNIGTLLVSVSIYYYRMQWFYIATMLTMTMWCSLMGSIVYMRNSTLNRFMTCSMNYRYMYGMYNALLLLGEWIKHAPHLETSESLCDFSGAWSTFIHVYNKHPGILLIILLHFCWVLV